MTLYCVWISSIAMAGVLEIGAPRVEDARYLIPVILAGGIENVAALNFRMTYDPQVFEPVNVITGPAAAAAQKHVAGNVAGPGEYIVVMLGLNQNTVSQGEVARIVFRQVGEAEDGMSRLTVLDTACATWEGQEIPSEGGTRVVRFGESSEENPAADQDRDTEEAAPALEEEADAGIGDREGRRILGSLLAAAGGDRADARRATDDEVPTVRAEAGTSAPKVAEADAAAAAAREREAALTVAPVPASAGRDDSGPREGQRDGYDRVSDSSSVTATRTVESGIGDEVPGARTHHEIGRHSDATWWVWTAVAVVLVVCGLLFIARGRFFP
ncbi:MAG TPA: cohesin domain-containing protein [Candidatus Hydrogenedentes bacterium]|nr:cohesin domain-containing protein [Candidatus Hydrogenedentota bacterium]HNT87775.1 cohesin domain-containing protein [Candidatus Hydrogenedentota bacterium]